MIHHVFCNLFTKPTRTIASTSVSAFSDILQDAAGRAWTRCITTSARRVQDAGSESILKNTKNMEVDGREQSSEARSSTSTSWYPVSKVKNIEQHATPPSESFTAPRKSGRALFNVVNQPALPNISDSSPTHIQSTRQRPLTNACSLSDHDFQSTDPGRAPPYYIDDPPWNNATTVYSGPVVTLPSPPLPPPTTPASLYQNLLYLLSYHSISPPPLRDLLAYHASFPTDLCLRSTRSYNLLIGLAIRHAAYRSAEQLLSDLRAEKVQGDLETWKLCIRWLIRTGGWGVAWEEVMGAIRRRNWNVYWRNAGKAWPDMPLTIWLEFFGTMKRGAFRKRVRMRKWLWNGQGDVTREAAFEVLRETGDRVAADSSRYGMLMSHLPTLTQDELQRMPPRAMHLAVHMMLRTGQKDLALASTKSYLKGLPPKVDDNWARASVNLIHLHMIFPSTKQGLSGHHKIRKTTNSLLALHPQVRPNSTTLFLLLRSLRSTKRCGTIARNFVSDFKRRWGPGMEDRRVRRRVASLALKEGRRDIAEAMVKKDGYSRWSRMMVGLEADVFGGGHRPLHRKLLRACDRQVYGKKGKECWRWKVLRWQLKRKRIGLRWINIYQTR